MSPLLHQVALPQLCNEVGLIEYPKPEYEGGMVTRSQEWPCTWLFVL